MPTANQKVKATYFKAIGVLQDQSDPLRRATFYLLNERFKDEFEKGNLWELGTVIGTIGPSMWAGKDAFREFPYQIVVERAKEIHDFQINLTQQCPTDFTDWKFVRRNLSNVGSALKKQLNKGEKISLINFDQCGAFTKNATDTIVFCVKKLLKLGLLSPYFGILISASARTGTRKGTFIQTLKAFQAKMRYYGIEVKFHVEGKYPSVSYTRQGIASAPEHCYGFPCKVVGMKFGDIVVAKQEPSPFVCQITPVAKQKASGTRNLMSPEILSMLKSLDLVQKINDAAKIRPFAYGVWTRRVVPALLTKGFAQQDEYTLIKGDNVYTAEKFRLHLYDIAAGQTKWAKELRGLCTCGCGKVRTWL
jgi:hypothetical protein